MKISEYIDAVEKEFKGEMIIAFDLGISVNKKGEAVLDHYSQNRIKFTIIKKKKFRDGR